MADDAGTRLRNVSDYGDVDVPDLGLIIEAKHEVVVADADLAQRLIDTGAFIAVGKPGPKTGPIPTQDSTATTPPSGASTTTPTGDGTATTTGEEPTDDHAA